MSVLELKVNVWCIVAIAARWWLRSPNRKLLKLHKGSPNRKLFKLHKGVQNPSYTGVIYYTVNLFATQRKIYFFADMPHIIKTTRNCLYSSGGDVEHILTRDACGTLTNTFYGALPHKHIITIRREFFNNCQKSLSTT